MLDERDASTWVSCTSSAVNNVGLLTIDNILSLSSVDCSWYFIAAGKVFHDCRWGACCKSYCRCGHSPWLSVEPSLVQAERCWGVFDSSFNIFIQQTTQAIDGSVGQERVWRTSLWPLWPVVYQSDECYVLSCLICWRKPNKDTIVLSDIFCM